MIGVPYGDSGLEVLRLCIISILIYVLAFFYENPKLLRLPATSGTLTQY